MINRRKFLKALALSLIAPEMLLSRHSKAPRWGETIDQHRESVIREQGVPESIVKSDSLSNRVEFKIDGDYIDTDLNNFPIYIGVSHVRADGDTEGYVYFDYSKTGARHLSPRIGTVTWKEI